MKHLLLTVVLGSLLTGAAACGGGNKGSTATKTSGSSAQDDGTCPVAVAGTSVSVEDTDTGAALVFVTTGDVAEVRKRVAAMAQMHNQHHGSMGALPDGSGPAGGHAGHDMSKMGSGSMAGHDMSNMGSGSMAGHDMSKMGSGSMAGHDMSKMGSGSMAGHDMSNMAGHDMSGMAGMISVHSQATSSDTDRGAKLVLTVAPSDVAKLQEELRTHAQHMSNGSCAMEHH